MPRAKLSDVSLKQLVAELARRKSRLADLLARREAIRRAIAEHDAISREIAELEGLGLSSDVEQTSMAGGRQGWPPGKPGRTAGAARAIGKTLAEYPLGAVPVFDGLAAAQGRLYLTLRDGRLLCFGRR